MVEGGVGAVVSGAGCGGGAVAAILVSGAEMAAKKVGVLAAFSLARHSRHATSKRPVALIMLYPMRMTDASLGASLPAVANRMPTLS